MPFSVRSHVLSRGGLDQGRGSASIGRGCLPPVNRMTHASENLTYLAVGNKKASNVNRRVDDSMGEIVKKFEHV